MEFESWDNLEQVLDEYKNAFQAGLQEHLQKDGSNASYSLLNSIEMKVEVDDKVYSVHCSLLDYYKYLDEGTPPHKKKGDGTFVKMIKKWILVKPVKPYPTANGKLPTVDQLTFLISRKIRLNGTEGTKFFTNTKEQINEVYKDKIKSAIKKDIRINLKEYLNQLSNKYN